MVWFDLFIVYLDDVTPNRVVAVYVSLQQDFWTHSRIRINGGNFGSGARLAACDILAREVNPEAVEKCKQPISNESWRTLHHS